MVIQRLPAFLTTAILALAIASPGLATTQWRQIDTAPGFHGWRAQLQHMVDRDGRSGVNHFCAVVATGRTAGPDDSYTWAYVYWREASKLYTFAQSDEGLSDMSAFKAPLDLNSDVVSKQRDLHGSTFLVTRSWLRNVLSHCAKVGTQVSLRKSA